MCVELVIVASIVIMHMIVKIFRIMLNCKMVIKVKFR